MNKGKIGKIKQIFVGLAKTLIASQNAPIPVEGDDDAVPISLPTIRWGVIQSPGVAEACGEALDALTVITEPEQVWSRYSVDEIVWEFADRIIDLPSVKQAAGVNKEVEWAVRGLVKEPSIWTVEILIYGLHESCSGIQFGKLLFLRDDLSEVAENTVLMSGFPRGPHILARLETTAVDENSAIERAGRIIDEHLMILNAVCSQESPSWSQVSRSEQVHSSYSAERVAPRGDHGKMRARYANYRMPLMGDHLKAVVKSRLVARISDMLVDPETEFTSRILRGYQFLGAGCVDRHPERSFLMIAIALESAVLGKDTKSELTHQLASRVAHLIGNGLAGRKFVVQEINDLYDRRSRIVHRGEYGVSRRETAVMYQYCKLALDILVLSKELVDFRLNSELEGWFKDRTLGGPNHCLEKSTSDDRL